MGELCKISDCCKGILWIIGGSILLIHTLGFLERSLTLIIMLGSIAVIIYGFALLYREETIKSQLQKYMGYLKRK